jgi:endonuclease/exonuclease/phosphatase (EEP) superfamily protein YafD
VSFLKYHGGDSRLKIATWNLKYAVAPRAKTLDLLSWAEANIAADAYAFTESNMPADLGAEWNVLWNSNGVHTGVTRKWGTTLASTKVKLVPVEEVKVGFRSHKLRFEWPAAVQVADIVQDGNVWGTLVGLYGVTRDGADENTGNGTYSVPKLLKQLKPLFDSPRGKRVVVAGDFNLWPGDVQRFARKYGLIDLVEHTASTRQPLENCWNCKYFPEYRRVSPTCGHLFTHRNGPKPKPGKKFGGMIQQIDYIWASPELAKRVVRVHGGHQSFPDIWDLSDHAPVIAEFES